MADKKRKVASAAVEQPSKKSKKSSSKSILQASTANDLPQAMPSQKAAVSNTDGPARSKKDRKRAADFMSDEDETTPKKKSKAKGRNILSADGVNGLIEQSSDEETETATKRKPVETSMMAEAERTADQELEDEFGGISDDEDGEEIDHAPALLTGFDSDTEDLAEDKDLDTSRTAPIPQFKKTNKKLRKAAAQKSEGPGAVYVGRIPHGFYEHQMREYFSQFGTITKLRLSRNKRTGASKHFAFIEFESEEVAKIVAEAMDNYLMFGHILKCKFAPAESLHPDVWKGANKKFRKIPHQKLIRQREEAPKTQVQWEKKIAKERKKREKKAEQMKQIGYKFNMPPLTDPAAVLKQRELEGTEETAKAIEGEKPETANSAPQIEELQAVEGTPKATREKKVKKSKSKDGSTVTQVQEVITETSVKAASKINGNAESQSIKEPTTRNKKEKKVTESTSTSAKNGVKIAPSEEKPLKSILKKPKKA